MTIHKDYLLRHCEDIQILIASSRNQLDTDTIEEDEVDKHLAKAMRQITKARILIGKLEGV